MKLRWKLEEKKTGLSAISAGPRGSFLYDGKNIYARVFASGGGWRDFNGWFWVAGWDSNVPYKNTFNNLCSTVEEAKNQASEYVNLHISTLSSIKGGE